MSYVPRYEIYRNEVEQCLSSTIYIPVKDISKRKVQQKKDYYQRPVLHLCHTSNKSVKEWGESQQSDILCNKPVGSVGNCTTSNNQDT